jgi:hypothetical protein
MSIIGCGWQEAGRFSKLWISVEKNCLHVSVLESQLSSFRPQVRGYRFRFGFGCRVWFRVWFWYGFRFRFRFRFRCKFGVRIRLRLR